ncbi:hypothetical protein ACROYT_G027330 [Oculina patagonica]
MESISSDSDCDSVASYADVVKGESLFSSSPARLTNSCWFKFQVESEEEAMQIALKKSASDAQGDEISDDDSLETTTPGFKEISKPRVKKTPEMFESWEEEDYCPGEPQIPLGSYKYKNVKDFPKTKGGSSLSETKKLGDVKGKKKVVSTNKNIHRADGKAIPEVFIDLTCDSPEKRPKKERRSTESSDDDDSGNADFIKKRKKVKLDPSLWYGVDVEAVNELPYDIDGTRVFQVRFDRDERNVRDGRSWKPWVTSSRKGFRGKRNVQSCKGSYLCKNNRCPYEKQFGKANNVQFVKAGGKYRCRSCNGKGEYISCPARKVSEYPQDSAFATIYHLGTHTCTAKRKPKLYATSDIEQFFKTHSMVKPSAVPTAKLTTMIREGKTWSEVEDVAEAMLDKNKVKNIKAKVVNSMHPHGHNFDAVAEIKKKTDEKDPYLIWKINNLHFNNGLGSLVFKMSKEKAEMCVQMDKDQSEHPLSKEFCFLDAVHSRCQGFKTLTLWVWHPTLNELVNLATMECEAESSLVIQSFWNNVNEVLRDFTGDENYLFNPAGWMFDEAGGNWDAIENVFGKEALEQCVSCEFHFFQCCNRQVHTDWSDKAKHRFKTLARSIFEAPTPYQYDQARKELIAFSQEKPGKRGQVVSWFKWWHKRRTHIFKAFKCGAPLAPNVNLAEVGHSQWAKKGSYRLTLAMAAEEDVAEAIMLSKKLESYGYGNYKGGQHRSQSDRLKANYFQQMARAKAFAEEISAGVVDNTLYVAAESSRASTVDANCSHRATRKRKRQVSVFSDGTHLESSSSEDDSQQTADKDGAKEDKRDGRFRTTASKAFQRSLELAKKEKLVVVDSNELGRNEREFTIRSGLNTYNVTISEHPTCDCPYANSANICKHVLFVLLNFFQVKEGDYRLHQKALTKSEVDALFKGLDLKSPTGTKPTNAAIFNKHKEAKKKQVWQ